MARNRIIPRVAEEIKRWDVNELSAKLDRLNICFSPINRPEDLLTDPHVLRPGGLVNNTNANGKPFRVPALPIEWNGGHLGEGFKCRCSAPTPRRCAPNSNAKKKESPQSARSQGEQHDQGSGYLSR